MLNSYSLSRAIQLVIRRIRRKDSGREDNSWNSDKKVVQIWGRKPGPAHFTEASLTGTLPRPTAPKGHLLHL